jgi:ADP-ribosylglycohydrolase
MENTIKAGIFGVCVGDALGVPVEFSREQLKRSPVTTMRAFGTHRQPAGTWSDDSSLALCLGLSYKTWLGRCKYF